MWLGGQPGRGVRSEAGERVGERVLAHGQSGLGPELGTASVSDESPGDVRQPVPQPLGFGELVGACQAEQPCPAEQVLRDQRDLKPGLRPSGQFQSAGELGDPRPVSGLPIAVDRSNPLNFWDLQGPVAERFDCKRLTANRRARSGSTAHGRTYRAAVRCRVAERLTSAVCGRLTHSFA